MNIYSTRRRFIHTLSQSAALLAASGALAEALKQTPAQTEGPFYPDKIPLDTDNDLLILNNEITPAVGEVTFLSGKVTDISGKPLRGALVEIWQCDANGVYLHTKDSGKKKARQDAHFQGFGRCLTNTNGEYLFRTIKPVPYTGRTPHIHFKIRDKGSELLTTQCYIQGHEGNAKDGIWKKATRDGAEDVVSVAFAPIQDAVAGELAARFDIVLGKTPKA